MSTRRIQLFVPLRRFLPVLDSLPCTFDEFDGFPFVISVTLSESVELSFTSSVSFSFDEPDFVLPVPLALDLPLGDLPLETGVFFGVPCFDFPAFSCFDLVDGVLVSLFDLAVLDNFVSALFDLLDPFASTLADLPPPPPLFDV